MNKPIRVLHNIASLHFGGSQMFVMNMYKNIDRTKVQFDFVVKPEEEKDLYEQVKQLGGRIYTGPKYTGRNHFDYCRWWDDFFTNHPEYHVIHGHVRSTAAIYLKIAKKHGLVTIAHSHNTSNGKGISAVVKYILQLPIRYIADYLFACSDKAGVWLFGKSVLNKTNYKMIPNGIDLVKFDYDEKVRNKMRAEMGVEDDTFLLGQVGRLTAQKNPFFLVQLFYEYIQINPNSKLLMLGDGELSGNIKDLCDKLGISDRVILPGSRANTNDYYQAMDVFVFPSLWEGLSIATIEAQANGLPCILSECIPAEAIVSDNVQRLALSEYSAWIEELEKARKAGRRKEQDSRLAYFNVSTTAKELQDFYLQQDGRKN